VWRRNCRVFTLLGAFSVSVPLLIHPSPFPVHHLSLSSLVVVSRYRLSLSSLVIVSRLSFLVPRPSHLLSFHSTPRPDASCHNENDR
jgi:hypothetical protein